MSTRISAPTSELSTLIDLLRWRASQQPEQRIYTFLQDGEIERDHLTLAELDRQARSIGAALQEYTRSGERALLIYPSGLEFIAAFYGCLYSGVIAVPVYPPSTVRSDSTFTRFRAIANNAQPAVVLTSSALAARVKTMIAQAPELQGARLILTDDLPENAASQWQRPDVMGESLAFLQYTSGSTGTPKGVMVSHANLLHNSSLIYRFSQHPPHAHAVIWLPLYHDMGLIGGVIQPLYAGFECTFLSPASILQRPVRWLQAITKTRATVTGGPNFAYELCVRKVTEEQKATLDLSSLELATNGSEPIRPETQARFNAAFASCGLRPTAFFPGYGMAETTLLVSSNHKQRMAPIKGFDREQLEQNRVVEVSSQANDEKTRLMISNGHPDQRIVIVDPETQQLCPPNSVGEIWVMGKSVAQGYWRLPEETEYAFHAYLADTHEGPFLRTGDMGFLYNGELYITGRLKDLIIIRGRNHYPQDIEKSLEQSHPALRLGGSIAFSVDAFDEERLVIVSEIERVYLHSDLQQVINAVRRTVAEQHELQTYAVLLLKPGTIPKTSSGKVARRACKAAFVHNELLEVVAEWRLNLEESAQPVVVEGAASASGIEEPVTQKEQPQAVVSEKRGFEEVQRWLIEQVARTLHVPVGEIDVQTPFAHYGMDSMQAVSMAADLEDRFQVKLPPTVIYDYPNIQALAHYVAHWQAGEPRSEEITEMRPAETKETGPDDIAIIGLGCRFPGADDPEAFWQMLRAGVDGISEVPTQRWDLQAFYSPDRATSGKMNTRWGGFLKQIDQFDPYFFKISPREASRMDPQQRLLLEVAWEALEYAGLAPEKLAGSPAGVFVGISSSDYSLLQLSDPSTIDAYSGIGNAHSIAANRLSYVLDLRGPSIAIDTACSSSLVAVHMACQSLRNGECELALAGGVNVILSPELTVTFSQARMMSEFGRCRTFDEEADGYVRSEGCGLVVLKPLSTALRDGDTVLAVIRGSAVNQDGRSNGITAPNGPAQEAVIRQALRNARVTPEQISYVETHGSSTPLGDPIEVESLKAVLMQQRAVDQPVVLGSVKTNIGHLESAAGIAGLIKTVLCLQHKEIPPHLHLKKLNPHISFADTSFELPLERRSWDVPAGEGRRLAGVSAFGFGGTNAHVILEEAPAQVAVAETPTPPEQFFTLSAQSKSALRTLAERYARYLTQHPEVSLTDLCATVNIGRARFAHRLAIVASSIEQLREGLSGFSTGQELQGVLSGQVQNGGAARRSIAFLFTGQGSQYPGMGRTLYETEPIFRAALERCDRIMRDYLEQPLLSVIYPESGSASLLNETAYTQPALFALEYALAELWRAWGIEPDVVMGHSVGEYVAACVAGSLSLEDGCKLIATRGKLMQSLPERGTMAVIFAEQARVAKLLGTDQQQVVVATINGPQNTVISGTREAVQEALRRCEAEGLATHELTVSHAFHSPLMDPMLAAFTQVALEVQYRPLLVPLVCNLTGQVVPAGELLDADYWRQQTRNPVQFAAGMQTLASLGIQTFLEIGPNSVLLNMGKQCLPASRASWLPSLRKQTPDWQALLQSAATLFVQGAPLDWQLEYASYRRLALPTYPFEREYCWLETSARRDADNGLILEKKNTITGETQQIDAPLPGNTGDMQHPLLHTHMELVHPAGVHVWETALDIQRLPYLKDHRIQGAVAVPVSMYVEMAQAASSAIFGTGHHTLEEIELKKLLLLPAQGAQKVQVILSDANEHVAFQLYSHSAGVPEQPRGSWTLHATGKIRHY